MRTTGYWAGETVRLTKEDDQLVTDHRLSHTDTDVIVCTAKDVTDERIGPTDQNQLFDLLVDSDEASGFFTLDHEGHITRWTESAQQLMGYDAEEILGNHLEIFFLPEDRQDGVPEQLLDTAKDEGSMTDTRRQRHSDGTYFRAEVVISATYDDNRTLRGFSVVVKEA